MMNAYRIIKYLTLALPVATALQAATIQSNTVNFNLTTVDLISSFTPFNTALGTLTQVEVVGTDNLAATFQVTGSGQNGTFTLSAPFSYGADLSIATLTVSGLFSLSGSANCTSIGNAELSVCNGSTTLNGIQNPDVVIAPPTLSLSLFTTGSNIGFTLNPTQHLGSITQGGTGQVNSESENFTSGPTQSGSLDLVYTFTPAAQIPEPSSMILLSGGVGAMAWFARRRFAKKA
jgi:hypothetical protein